MSFKEYGSVVRGFFSGLDARTRQGLWAAVAVIALAGALVGYKWYAARYYAQVQQALSETLDLAQQAESQGDAKLWKEVEGAAKAGYATYGSSWLGSYFLALQADAYAQTGDKKEALEMLGRAVKGMKKSSPWYYLYATKYALMQCDAADSRIQQDGKKELTLLSTDMKNPQRDMALYYLGYYAFVQDGKQAARSLWESLMNEETFKDSPWAALARKKLA